MGILAIIVIGLVAAFIARAVLPARRTMGLVISLVLGVAGGFIGAIAGTIVSSRETVFDGTPLILAFSAAGAIVVLGLATVGHRLRA